MQVSSNKPQNSQQHSPPDYTVTANVSSGTQVWSHYYASLPSVRNTVILLKVLDSHCAPFPASIMFNYSPLEPPEAAIIRFGIAALECLFDLCVVLDCMSEYMRAVCIMSCQYNSAPKPVRQLVMHL